MHSPEHERTPTALSEARNVSRGGVTYLLNGAEKHGWIKRLRSSSDHRSYTVSLAEKGEALLGELQQHASKFLERHLAPLDDRGISEFVETMGALTGADDRDRGGPAAAQAVGAIPVPAAHSFRPTNGRTVPLVSVLLTVLDDPGQAASFRGQFVQELVRRNLLDRVPARLLDGGAIAVAALSDDHLVGFVQVRLEDGRRDGRIEFILPLVDELGSLQEKCLNASLQLLEQHGYRISGDYQKLSLTLH
jgi:DNA-binding MarR family transcriptional regulator